MIRKEIIILCLIIISLLLCGCFSNDDNNGNPTLKIDSADLELYKADDEYIGEDDIRFNYEFSYKNFPENGGKIKWSIILIGNDTIYSTTEFESGIRDSRGNGDGIQYLSFESEIPIPDKYRVEVYWRDKLMDSIEKDVVSEP